MDPATVVTTHAKVLVPVARAQGGPIPGRLGRAALSTGLISGLPDSWGRTDAKLSPDGWFALCYGDRKRIFLVEADCATERNRSDNLKRKSHKHNILSYHAFLLHGDVRRKIFGDALVAVLNVFSEPRAMKVAMEVHEEQIGNRGKFMLYNTWDAFNDYFRPPPPRPDLFLKSWARVGNPPFFISQVTKAEQQPVLSPLQPGLSS